MPEGMTYIVQRKDRFYVVAYDGLDPLTGKERRRWHPVGGDRHDAELMAGRIDRDNAGAAPARGGPTCLGEFLTDTWLPLKRRSVRATTAYRYSWFVDRYINPVLGEVPLRRLRADHLDGLYDQLATTAGRHGTGLAPKTVHEVHMACGPLSTSPCAASCSTTTSLTPPTSAAARLILGHGPGPPRSSPHSCRPPGPNASTRRFT
jgi:hypothetical protein